MLYAPSAIIVGLAAAGLLTPASLAESSSPHSRDASSAPAPTIATLLTPTISLDLDSQPEAPPTAPHTAADSDPDPSSSSRIPFGRAGSNSLVFGLGYTNDFGDIQGAEIHAGYAHFLADDIEFTVELTAWYFDEDAGSGSSSSTDQSTGALNPGFQFRWHFLHADDYAWSVYAEAGIGLLFAFDNFPDNGTGFNFSPRAGLGTTFRITDDGLRLQLGARWQHFSNGRIEGDVRNPGYDGLMSYIGLIIPLN